MKNTDPILNLTYAELLLKSLEELRSVMSEQSGESLIIVKWAGAVGGSSTGTTGHRNRDSSAAAFRTFRSTTAEFLVKVSRYNEGKVKRS
ncbi:hypothetical protein C4803_02850 [Salmonella enterica subsp. arizonae serovar 51:g,z51:-]|nr:hypothetical protein C4803_02850 [Salmonella enterica subsp. arizonae serovar 51:g,z51:-]